MEKQKVVAAIIIDHYKTFTTKKEFGDFPDGWKFPSSILHDNENPEEVLKRTVLEKLHTEIEIHSFFQTIEYDYPSYHLSMDCYWCSLKQDSPLLLETEDSQWLVIEQIDSVAWLPAEATIIEDIRSALIAQTQCGFTPRQQTYEICKILTDHGYDVGPGLEYEDGDQLEYEIGGILVEIGMQGYDCSLYFADENYNVYTCNYVRITYLDFLKKLKESV